MIKYKWLFVGDKSQGMCKECIAFYCLHSIQTLGTSESCMHIYGQNWNRFAMPMKKSRKEMSGPGLKYHARHISQCQRRTVFHVSQFWEYLNLKRFSLFTMNLKVLLIPINDNLYSLKVLSPRYFYWQRWAKLKFDYDMDRWSHHIKI